MNPVLMERSYRPFATIILVAGLLFSVMDFNSCLHCSAQECEAALPQVIMGGKRVAIEKESTRFPKHYGSFPPRRNEANNRGDNGSELEYFVLNNDKPFLYVKNFLNHSIANDLKALCVEGGRFVRSSIRGTSSVDGDGQHHQDPTKTSVQKHDIRTSESCNMVPAAIYRNSIQAQALFAQDPMPPNVAKIKREVDISWFVAQRASQLLGVDPSTVEPLQLVRYMSPDAEYKLHHDHGGYYGEKTEVRPWTMLVFLNDVVEGGHTAFPRLDLEVIPRFGDAVVWSNVKLDEESNGSLLMVVDEDMVHAGSPPAREGIEKYAMNVWFGQQSVEERISEGRWHNEQDGR